MRRGALLVLAALALLPGCGARRALRPAVGTSLPVKPALDPATPTTDQLLTPPVQTRPGRSDELLKKSEERRDDRFDLPPPG